MPARRRFAIKGRRRGRLDLLLGALVILAVVVAIVVHQGTASSQDVAASSPRLATVAFAQSYLSYLDGVKPASQLPAASAGVRSLAASAPPIPADARRGPLKLLGVRLTYVRGALTARAVAVGRDDAHRYPFSLALSYVNGRWVVVYLLPPDVVTILAHRARPPAPPPALQRAAIDFALAYASYREGVRRAPPAGLSTLAQQIAGGRDPLAHIVPSHTAPRLVSVHVGPAVEGAAAASAVLTDGGRKLRFVFDLQQSAGRWQPLGFPEAP